MLEFHLESDCPNSLLSCNDCNFNQFERKSQHICFRDFFGQINSIQLLQQVQQDEINVHKTFEGESKATVSELQLQLAE